MKVLILGDVMGKPGRHAMRAVVPGLVRELGADFVIANCENATGGSGITPADADELFGCDVDVLTSGNHIWHKKEIFEYLTDNRRILRPENFARAPGRGYTVIESRGAKVGVLNLQGRVFMPQYVDDPFAAADRVVALMRERGVLVIIVDVHAETTSEKIALARYLDGRVSAVVGTHTHVQTSDEEIMRGGTARITDLGMTGPHDSVIGMRTDLVLERFLTQRGVPFEVAKNDVRVEGVLVDVDEQTGKARAIERVRRRLPDAR